eukprot:2149851-Pleurochrysis_carterae.AAC.1
MALRILQTILHPSRWRCAFYRLFCTLRDRARVPALQRCRRDASRAASRFEFDLDASHVITAVL